jgi:hypothetical protein
VIDKAAQRKRFGFGQLSRVNSARRRRVFGHVRTALDRRLGTSNLMPVSTARSSISRGEVGFAVGVEKRTERLKQTSDRNSQAATFGWDSATTLDPFSASRNVEAAFINVRVPILGDPDGKGMRLVAEGALRYEKYSDTMIRPCRASIASTR